MVQSQGVAEGMRADGQSRNQLCPVPPQGAVYTWKGTEWHPLGLHSAGLGGGRGRWVLVQQVLLSHLLSVLPGDLPCSTASFQVAQSTRLLLGSPLGWTSRGSHVTTQPISAKGQVLRSQECQGIFMINSCSAWRAFALCQVAWFSDVILTSTPEGIHKLMRSETLYLIYRYGN